MQLYTLHSSLEFVYIHNKPYLINGYNHLVKSTLSLRTLEQFWYKPCIPKPIDIRKTNDTSAHI